MSATSRQAKSTVKTMKELGYTCDNGVWTSSPEAVAHLARVADKMHALLVERADELDGCTEGSSEETEYTKLIEAIDAYEEQRWPDGKTLAARVSDLRAARRCAPDARILQGGARVLQLLPAQLVRGSSAS